MVLKLSDITLVGVDCTDRIMSTIDAMNISSQGIIYGETILFSHKKPALMPSYFKFIKIPKIENIDEYSYFMFKELGNYINTSHCLTVHDHGHVICKSCFDYSWLQYDWIGAPWSVIEGAYIANNGEIARVGNGGFSLRSSRILKLPIEKGWYLREEQGWKNEDGNFCCYWRKEMLENGIKYAPIEVAAKFSYENDVPENKDIKDFFGFHKHDPRIVRRYNE